MCEERDCGCNHGRHHHRWHHRHHRKGYVSIVKRGKDNVIVPEALLEVAGVDIGDFLEIRVRKIKKHESHHDD